MVVNQQRGGVATSGDSVWRAAWKGGDDDVARPSGARGAGGGAHLGARPSGAQDDVARPSGARGAGGGQPNGGMYPARPQARRSRALQCAWVRAPPGRSGVGLGARPSGARVRAAANRTAGRTRPGHRHAGAVPYTWSARREA